MRTINPAGRWRIVQCCRPQWAGAGRAHLTIDLLSQYNPPTAFMLCCQIVNRRIPSVRGDHLGWRTCSCREPADRRRAPSVMTARSWGLFPR